MGKLSEPLQLLTERLQFHAQVGGVLEGFFVKTIPVAEADGPDDLPCIRIVRLEVDEEVHSRNASWAEFKAVIEVGVAKSTDVVNAIEALEKACDAIELDEDGAVDLNLGNTTINGIAFKSSPSAITGNGIYLQVEVELETKPFSRACRRGDQQTVSAPVLSPDSGDFTDEVEVTMTSATSGASIYYTLDGSRPTNDTGILYTAPITITDPRIVRAIAYKSGSLRSAETIKHYCVTPTVQQVATPQFSPAGGSVSEETEVTLTCATTGASIYYTLDGSEPDATDTLYSGPITVSETTLIRAIAVKSGLTDSKQNAAHYVFASSGGGPANATLEIGTVADNNGLIFTAVASGSAGNGVPIHLIPDLTSQNALTVVVDDGRILVGVGVASSNGAFLVLGEGDAGLAFVFTRSIALLGLMWSVEIVDGVGPDSDVTAENVEGERMLRITLGTDSSGDPDPAKNTALAIAIFLQGLEPDPVTVDGLVGDGSGVVTPAAGRLSGESFTANFTAAQLKSAIESNAEASALVTVAHMEGSDGSGAVDVAMRTSGGVD